jgi:hypothetical protein
MILSVVTLQNCMAVLRDELGSCQTLSGDENQFLFVNAEEFMGIEVEEDPRTSAVIKPEPAISCVSVYLALCIVSRYPEFPVTLPVCLFVCPQNHLYTGECGVISFLKMWYTNCAIPCPF